MGKIKCLDCLDVIESTHRHDFVRCKCGESFVDGGDAYLRVGGNPAIWNDEANDFLLPMSRDEELAAALKSIDDFYDSMPQPKDRPPVIDLNGPHTANLGARYRYRLEGAQHERERLLDLFKEHRACRHNDTCKGQVNIYEHMLSSFGIDLEKLMDPEYEEEQHG